MEHVENETLKEFFVFKTLKIVGSKPNKIINF